MKVAALEEVAWKLATVDASRRNDGDVLAEDVHGGATRGNTSFVPRWDFAVQCTTSFITRWDFAMLCKTKSVLRTRNMNG